MIVSQKKNFKTNTHPPIAIYILFSYFCYIIHSTTPIFNTMRNKHILSNVFLLLLCSISFINCSSEPDPQKDTKITKLFVSAETGLYKSGDLTQDIPSFEGMKIKEAENRDWNVVPYGCFKVSNKNFRKTKNNK